MPNCLIENTQKISTVKRAQKVFTTMQRLLCVENVKI